MRNINQLFKSLSCFALLLCTSLYAQSEQGSLLPSEVFTLMVNEVNMHPEKKRIDATKPFLSRAITKDLSRREQFFLGEIYFWNFLPEKAFESFSKVKSGSDEISRAAWQRILQINFRAFEKHEEVEKEIPEFKKLFKPDPKDRFYMFDQINNLGNKYAVEGNHEKVIELVNQELNSLDYNGAYQSFLLPAYLFKSYKALGKEDLAFKLLEKTKASLEAALAKRKENIPQNDPDYTTHSSRVRKMETIVTHKLSYAQMNDEYERLIESITKAYNYYKGI